MKDTLEFIAAGAEVTRYHTVFTINKETVGHHSHGVAMMVLMIKPDASASLLKAALYHDLAEQVVGDIPSPAKRRFDLGKRLDELEHAVIREAGIEQPELNDEEVRVLKLADIAQGALFCAREVQLGNVRLVPVFARYLKYAIEMNLEGREAHLFTAISEIYNER
jgi:5'-deoxynucleotidase YfbR-like HD superfamily hydrolase